MPIDIYNALRGRDAKSGIDNPEKRDEQFERMQVGQAAALNLANWHHFLSALTLAGYRGEKMISSETAIIYSYVLYLVGIVDYGIDKQSMRQAIAEFFFMAALTGRYTTSPETRFESDLAQIRGIKTGDVVSLASRVGATTLRAKVSDRMPPGVVYTTFHHPVTGANVITTENSDWATNCPEYKVTAVQVTVSNHPSNWQAEWTVRNKENKRVGGKSLEPAE